eukprot:1290581-Prymnesium_polylepis.2
MSREPVKAQDRSRPLRGELVGSSMVCSPPVRLRYATTQDIPGFLSRLLQKRACTAGPHPRRSEATGR